MELLFEEPFFIWRMLFSFHYIECMYIVNVAIIQTFCMRKALFACEVAAKGSSTLAMFFSTYVLKATAGRLDACVFIEAIARMLTTLKFFRIMHVQTS